ncbi:hypothetical protein CWO91_02850 [Bradyrhizobium genosp. SA-3]|nr:hypothetical protein CWO91_02850 [Bradyrhizobium genosp. SA-3]
MQGQISLKLDAQKISLTHPRILPKPASKSVQTASGLSVAAYSLEAHTRDNLLFPIASIRSMSGKLSMHFDPGTIARISVQFLP